MSFLRIIRTIRSIRIIPGFTLVEILIYMGIMAVFVTVLTNIFLSVLETQVESSATSLVEVDGRYVLSRLIYDIHQAAGITTPASPGQSSSSLVLNSHSFDVSNGALLIDGTDNLTGVDTTVSNFSVTRLGNGLGNDTLQISFDLTSGAESRNYQTTVSLRPN